jgi:hypothetical protein
MIPRIKHINSKLANTESPWSAYDSEELFNKNMADSRRSARLIKYGWDQPSKINYRYNSHGFRTPEFDDRRAGLALGCSFTEGIGLPAEHTWPATLSKMLDFPVWNLGVAGSSADSCFRILDHYIDQLNIEFVVMCVPNLKRFEFFDEGGIQYVIPETKTPEYAMPYYKHWVVIEENAQINQKKNLLAMQKICDDRRIKLAYLHHTDFELCDEARDLAHPGIDANKNFTLKMLKQL